jgi:hypothetical protein
MVLPSRTSPKADIVIRSRPWEEEGRHQWRHSSRYRSLPSRCLPWRPRGRSAAGAHRVSVQTAIFAVLLLQPVTSASYPDISGNCPSSPSGYIRIGSTPSGKGPLYLQDPGFMPSSASRRVVRVTTFITLVGAWAFVF